MMKNTEEMLNKIIDWAKDEEAVRGVIIVGSRALQEPTDDLADFDISLFVKDTKPFVEDDSWISKIEKVWVYSPDKYVWHDITTPTRLVIYDGGVKVDYSLWNISVAQELGQSNFYDSGYKVLLDKDQVLANFKTASFKNTPSKKPTQEEFTHSISEFWFEAYHVAKYLKREDLWLVKFRDWSLQVYLLKIMEWYMLSKNNWGYDVKWTGKNIKKWLDPEVYKRLENIFSHFDKEDSWKGLIARIDLFRDLSKEIGKNLGYKYPEEVDKNLTGFILNLSK